MYLGKNVIRHFIANTHLTKMFVVLGFGEKQSSPTLTREFVTVKPSVFKESKPSVFFGSVETLVETASM